MKVIKKDLINAEERIRNFIKDEDRQPNLLKLGAGNIKKEQYLDLFYRVNQFRVNRGRWPEFATVLGTNNSAAPQDYQNDKYSCGPASLSMGSAALFNYKTEQAFRNACGTTVNGTTPQKLIAGAAKLGFNLTRIPRNKVECKKSLDKGRPVLAHIQTKKAPCLRYKNDYGHYILIKDIINNNYLTNDPTMGENKLCNTVMLDLATGGRSIYYYSMSLK
jgi:hypothetical protein